MFGLINSRDDQVPLQCSDSMFEPAFLSVLVVSMHPAGHVAHFVGLMPLALEEHLNRFLGGMQGTFPQVISESEEIISRASAVTVLSEL